MISKANWGLELHDSQLDPVNVLGQTCLIALRPADVYEISVESGDVIGPCMSVDAVFEVADGVVDGQLGDLSEPILNGSLTIGLERMPDLTPAPFTSTEAVTLTLFLWPYYRRIVISGRNVKMQFDGVPRLLV